MKITKLAFWGKKSGGDKSSVPPPLRKTEQVGLRKIDKFPKVAFPPKIAIFQNDVLQYNYPHKSRF